MPKGIPNPKPAVENDDAILARMIAEEAEQKAAAEIEPKPKMVAMQLLRNYRPAGDFEIVGHIVPAVIRKDGAGREVEVQKATFVEGEGAPPPQAGVGTTGKIWSGTIIRVPQDEARTMRANEIAERSVDD